MYPNTPGYKATETSKEASETIDATTWRNRSYQKIKENEQGLTADECADLLDISILTIRPRFSELKRNGLIQDSGLRRLNNSGKRAIVWIVRNDLSVTQKLANKIRGYISDMGTKPRQEWVDSMRKKLSATQIYGERTAGTKPIQDWEDDERKKLESS